MEINNNQNQLQVAADKIREQKNENLGNFIKEIFEEIVDDKKNVAIPELVFESVYLPAFKNMCSKDDAGKKVDNSSVVLTWIGLTGSQYKGADIVDREGKVIITTPPLYSEPVIDNKGASGMSAVGEVYIEKLAYNANDADGYLESKLGTVVSKLKVEKDENVEGWNKVFDYFDNKNKPIKNTTTTSPMLLDDEDTGYKLGGSLLGRKFEDDDE